MAVTQSLVPLTPLRMAMALALMVIMALASAKLRLGLEKNIFIGSFRTTAQLLVLGLLLHPIFLENKPWIVLLYLALMILLAARECYARPRFEYRGMWGRILLTMLLSTRSSRAGARATVTRRPRRSSSYFFTTVLRNIDVLRA